MIRMTGQQRLFSTEFATTKPQIVIVAVSRLLHQLQLDSLNLHEPRPLLLDEPSRGTRSVGRMLSFANGNFCKAFPNGGAVTPGHSTDVVCMETQTEESFL